MAALSNSQRNFLRFMKPEDLLPFSQEHATSPSPHSPPCFPKMHLNNALKVFFKSSSSKSCMLYIILYRPLLFIPAFAKMANSHTVTVLKPETEARRQTRRTRAGIRRIKICIHYTVCKILSSEVVHFCLHRTYSALFHLPLVL